MKLKKKTKRRLGVFGLLLAAIGVTALISYGSSGFTKWTKEDWRERFVIQAVEEEEDDDDITDPTDTTPEPSGTESQ